ncbi:MAG: hypothetical protein EBY11_09245, partial [Proteobacteria bacterium]|nr:hypothetical protein [Pseudomonadota bacterium]
MQNKELRAAQVRSTEHLERYTDLYDFAPVGYFTFTTDGTVRAVNLLGATLAGLERGRLVGRRFGLFVNEADRGKFSDFLKCVLTSEGKQSCEVRLAHEGTVPRDVKIDGLRSVDGQECHAVLMDGDDPVGGRWNFDTDNRESPPKGASTLGVPAPYHPVEDDIDADVRRDIDRMALDTVGIDGPRLFPVTPTEADEALRRFIADRLPFFGRYEDAMMGADWSMAHSLLSVPLNLGVLHPLDAVHAAEAAYHDGSAPLAAVEGFIRQILGWREYMWQLYWHFGPDYLDNNSLDAHTPLPDWWTDLDVDAVDAECLSQALAGVRDRGWAHHIQRLMVLGSHGLQRGYQPRELSEWFASSFVDGFAWVMPTNVIGMSQHADGGLLATKPYTSGGAYINKMSDHCRSCRFDPKKRLGEDACPFTAGYWAFVDRHHDMLAANMRTSRAVSSLRRLSDLEAVLEQERHREHF